ncbi:type III pantothenate kinase [Marinobacter sediminum]|uniref:type III pantothenate kinase n=1 Tax=Marinobacter sediminum TaxID=256323 RepID=UPI00202DC2AF|nr:type III pantothenate kinase [Marinobacter sediminum]MCM0614386.1 type III pantothenate kinase [Marinobacter sediminum]
MRLLVDAGNSRLKWRLEQSGKWIEKGTGALDDTDPLHGLPDEVGQITRVAVSTVASEEKRLRLLEYLVERTGAPVSFYWAEAARGGLTNAYAACERMGADRWHAMYGAWQEHRRGFAVVDAGSAVTVDYVDPAGQHLGGFILPGLQMMLRSLRSDAARIGFDPDQVLDTRPGVSTGECVNHGLAWLSGALVAQIHADAGTYGLPDILVTGGDADRLIGLGLAGVHHPSLVLEGLQAIDAEECRG